MSLKINIVSPNFKYPDIKQEDFKVGTVSEVDGNILRSDGDWRPYLPPQEEQRRNEIESSSCFIQAQTHTIATILEEQFDIVDENFSERFNFIFADPSPQGGSPLKGAESIRNKGLIPDSMLPFSDDIDSWDEFNSFSGGNQNECLKKGKEWLSKFEPLSDIVFERWERVEDKYKKARKFLKSSPLPVSVYAWVEDDGVYIKPEGVQDNHLVELVHIDDDNCPWVWDTYGPDFLKKLAPFYPFEFGMRWTVNKLKEGEIKKKSWWQEFIDNLARFFNNLFHEPIR